MKTVLELQHLALKWAWKMTPIEDSQERQSEFAHLLYKDSSCVGSDIGNYRQLKREYLLYIYVCKR